MRWNPYDTPIRNIRQVMNNLIKMMCNPEVEMSLFKNIAAVYVSWQADLHLAQIAAMNWDHKNRKDS